MSNKLIGVVSLGCDKNRVDTEYMMSLLKKAGYSFVNTFYDADLVIINTCAFILPARKEAIDTILEAAAGKRNDARLIVTGCLPQKYSNELAELHEVDRFVSINEYDNIVNIVEEVLGRNFIENNEENSTLEKIRPLENACVYRHSDRVLTTPAHYAYLKIADGCDNFCTYCTIPSIRGKYRSRTIEDIVSEAHSLKEGGVKEVILVAQDVTNYGADLYGAPKLAVLLKKLDSVGGIMIRLLYCYPERIDNELIEEIKSNNSVIKYIDIPLQHCNSRILKLMGRKSTKESIEMLLSNLRTVIPDIAIRTTFIAGFPGETEEEFNELLEFLHEQKFMNAGFFPYSPEEDTPSFRLRNHVPTDECERRAKAAYEVQGKIAEGIYALFMGTTQRVIVDEVKRLPLPQSRMTAALEPRTPIYKHKCRAYCSAPEIDGEVIVKSSKPFKCGECCNVVITKSKGYTLFGKII